MSTKLPVLILIDFVGGKVARYLGKTRTLLTRVDQPTLVMQHMLWEHTLRDVRYHPEYFDKDHPRVVV